MRYQTLKRRESVDREENNRIDRALAEARFWMVIEPTKSSFWETFWTKLEAGYPEWQWKRQPQTGLAEYTSQ